MIRNPRIVRSIAVYLLIQFTSSIIVPSVSYALTSGPSQPEFSSFEPVATTNMVDEFTGDFTYNLPLLEVPGPHGSGYPVSLSYHSGVTPEEEASWVGYGWTLNAGAINRNVRGLPDDYNGQPIKFHNKSPKNWTGTVGLSQAVEVFGKDGSVLTATQNMSLRYNNYRGFGYTAGIGMSLGKGLVSMGYSVSDGNGSFSLDVNPFAILSWTFNGTDRGTNPTRENLKRIKAGEPAEKKPHTLSPRTSVSLAGSSYGVFSFTHTSRPNVVTPFSGRSFNVSMGMETNVLPIPVGVALTGIGSYSYQQNDDVPPVPSYGFMYSKEGSGSDDNVMDYHVEQERDFSRRDVFLGVPFNDADNFMMTGEGVSGGFRLHNKTAGHFGPRKAESNLEIWNVGYEIGVGWTFGPGGDVGKGSYNLSARDWNQTLSSFQSINDPAIDEPVFFRFNNDLGGEWGDNHNDLPLRVNLSEDNISLPLNKEKYTLSSERNGRSSYIGFNRNGDMVDDDDNPTPQAYSKDKRVNAWVKRGDAAYKDLIGELAVYNEAGMRYVYGLPVFIQQEKVLSYSARDVKDVDANFIAYTSKPDERVKVGEEKNMPYANTYLLTEITTPDYVDRGTVNNGTWGPSQDDLGGYTYFNYTRATSDPGTDGNGLFRWRMPYRGMLYKKNSQSDPLDDLVSYSEGLKELYYMQYIETKSHVAFFKTSDRTDGREAETNAFSRNSVAGSVGGLYPKRLDEINLYLVSDCERDPDTGHLLEPTSTSIKPIKTVHFEYDYSLVKGVPNGGSGKLTLKRVYFEYNGLKRTTISPYDFEYSYPKSVYANFPDRYKAGQEDVTMGYTNFTEAQENPPYTNFLLDAWGNYQANGESRFQNDESWVNQNAVPGFDPAAWQLKAIHLPSGGQILVQYEQDEYSYVQDQEAHVMASLLHAGGEDLGAQRFLIDPASIGLGSTPSMADLNNLVDMLNKRYHPGGKKIYFKFLYNLLDNRTPSLQSCNTEFISGYANVSKCGLDEQNRIYIDLYSSEKSKLPRVICEEFVKSSRLGKIYPGQDCNPGDMSEPSDAIALANQLLGLMEGLVFPGGLCKPIDLQHSYFRIPTPLAKKGGGIRVKRLLMYDRGLENDAVLYGNEYIYQVKNAEGRMISSGVATNEPGTIREENILVDFVARKGQDLWSKLVAGKDKDQSEGPIGESVLPAPSVGYSSVIVRNIYNGKSAPGYSVKEFYTAREYPVKLGDPNDGNTMTDIQRNTDDPFPLTLPLYTKIKNKVSAVQGFSFVLNSMHGRSKSSGTFEGAYNGIPRTGEAVSSVRYEYFDTGDPIPVQSSRFGGLEYKKLGREVEITFAQRKVTEHSKDLNVEVDLQATVIPLFVPFTILYPTAIPAFSDIQGELNTHSTSKVVRYPAILKKTTIVDNGIEHTEENLAFDANTGLPVAVRATDEFKGAYLTQTIPASWEYPEMAGKWKNEGKRLIGGTFTLVDGLLGLGDDPCNLAMFGRGDLIRLGDASSNSLYHVLSRDYANNALRLELAQGGAAVTGSVSQITVIRSGRTNQLQANAGSITIHNEVSNRLTPIGIDAAGQYSNEQDKVTNGKRSFSQELEAATRTDKLTGEEGDFTMAGPYTDMDITGFSGMITDCAADLLHAEVKNLKFLYLRKDDVVTLQLVSFQIKCGSEDRTIKAEGWQ